MYMNMYVYMQFYSYHVIFPSICVLAPGGVYVLNVHVHLHVYMETCTVYMYMYVQYISAPLQQEPVNHTLFLSFIST